MMLCPLDPPFFDMAFWCIARILFLLPASFARTEEVAWTDGPQSQGPDCEAAIGCSCEDLGPVIAVVCHNVTDFEQLSDRLRDRSLYQDPLATYEITITGTGTFPRRSFEGLIVYRLYIEDKATRNVSDLVFEGVKRLRRFHVRKSSMQRFPNLSVISDSLRQLNFDESELTSIGRELQNLPLLVEVTARCNAIETVSADAFQGTTAIKILDFSGNQLEYLPETLFDSLERLVKLDLSRNRLRMVHGLLRVIRPMFIYLGHNNLANVDDILYDNMTSVVTLALNNNPLRVISDDSFNGKVPRVRFLYLDHCDIEEFDVSHYKSLDHLAMLELTGNRIKMIRNQTIDFGDRVQLLFSDNRIHSFEAQITYKAKRLYLSDNNLRMLGSILHLTQLQEIEIERNHLEALIETDMRGMFATMVFLLGGNSIGRIDTDVFVPIRNDLEVLDLRDNYITNLNGSVRYLSRLKSLNVSGNFIETFAEGEFVGLNELSELYMQHNRILALSAEIQRMPQLQFLTAGENNLTCIMIDHLPKSLRYLYYKDNPITCDCRFMPFVEWLRKSSLETDIAYCQRQESKALRGLIEGNYLLHEAEVCPRPCSCSCVQGLNESYLQLDCNSQSLSSVPSAFLSQQVRHDKGFAYSNTSYFGAEYLMQNMNEDIIIGDRVRVINFENNYLDNIDHLLLPHDLVELRLANNVLKTLPSPVFKLSRLSAITLSGNPWTCDCNAVEFKNWIISKAEKVLDRNETRCGYNTEMNNLTSKLLAVLSDVDLCPSNIGLYVSVVFAILTLLLVISALKIAYNRYEMHVKIWLYSHGVSWVKEKDLDKDKPFDAFISFSHGDEDFVINNIIAEIERGFPEVRLCLHYRDFLPGEYIHVNIMNAISSSKRTVIILSRSFLESEWCMLEFRAAHLQALEDKVQRVIVIKVGELPNEIDPAIKVYLESTTYIMWGEKFFWQKLAYALPSAKKQRPKHDSCSAIL